MLMMTQPPRGLISLSLLPLLPCLPLSGTERGPGGEAPFLPLLSVPQRPEEVPVRFRGDCRVASRAVLLDADPALVA